MEVSYDSIDLESIKSSAKRSWFLFSLNRLIWTNYKGDGAYNTYIHTYHSIPFGTSSFLSILLTEFTPVDSFRHQFPFFKEIIFSVSLMSFLYPDSPGRRTLS